jgi:hypothetical protein
MNKETKANSAGHVLPHAEKPNMQSGLPSKLQSTTSCEVLYISFAIQTKALHV